eukprot:TRINITY_DN1719_c0_g1_i1.p1 TRINITY_DN1719_c0_g1~~TRINITY_DN1719_c0_g1_i1.p1  ORF type:complete len:357 (+),score=59.91 TRINITY_DN1719_c0_g1_i1:561-1631(+)
MHLTQYLVLLVLLSPNISLGSDTSPQTPSVAFLFSGNWLASFRANDATERIFVAPSDNGKSFGPSSVLFGGIEKTFVTPGLFALPSSPFTSSSATYWLFWVDSATGRIRFSQNLNGDRITWTAPANINNLDSTSDTPVATFDPDARSICVFFRGRTTTNIYYTCSSTGAPGSWPLSTQIPGVATNTGPTATAFVSNFGFNTPTANARTLVSFKANDATGRIFVLQSASAGPSFSTGATLVQPFCCTDFSPSIFSLIQPGTGNLLPHLFWVDRSSRRIRFAVSVDNGRTWAGPYDTSADTTKDQAWAAFGSPSGGPKPFGISFVCEYFISNDATNIIRSTCSSTGFPGSWPISTPIN